MEHLLLEPRPEMLKSLHLERILSTFGQEKHKSKSSGAPVVEFCSRGSEKNANLAFCNYLHRLLDPRQEVLKSMSFWNRDLHDFRCCTFGNQQHDFTMRCQDLSSGNVNSPYIVLMFGHTDLCFFQMFFVPVLVLLYSEVSSTMRS